MKRANWHGDWPRRLMHRCRFASYSAVFVALICLVAVAATAGAQPSSAAFALAAILGVLALALAAVAGIAALVFGALSRVFDSARKSAIAPFTVTEHAAHGIEMFDPGIIAAVTTALLNRGIDPDEALEEGPEGFLEIVDEAGKDAPYSLQERAALSIAAMAAVTSCQPGLALPGAINAAEQRLGGEFPKLRLAPGIDPRDVLEAGTARSKRRGPVVAIENSARASGALERGVGIAARCALGLFFAIKIAGASVRPALQGNPLLQTGFLAVLWAGLFLVGLRVFLAWRRGRRSRWLLARQADGLLAVQRRDPLRPPYRLPAAECIVSVHKVLNQSWHERYAKYQWVFEFAGEPGKLWNNDFDPTGTPWQIALEEMASRFTALSADHGETSGPTPT